jgi:flagellar protein FlaG
MIDINSLNSDIRLQVGQKTSLSLRQGTGSSDGAKANAAPKAAGGLSAEKTQALAAELNKALEQVEGNYSVSVDDDTGMMVVRITDTETGDIVKQVPPQQVLDVSVSVEKIVGLLVNDQA